MSTTKHVGKDAIPRKAVAAILNREIASRAPIDWNGHLTGGRAQIVLEIAASGAMTKESAERRVYSILNGHTVSRSGRRYTQKWVTYRVVDKLLSALGREDLWYSELEKYLPKIPVYVPSWEEFDATCAECGQHIDWDSGSNVAGVRFEMMKRNAGGNNGGIYRWRWWSLCACCAADAFADPVPRPDATGKIRPPKIPWDDLRRLYKTYVQQELGLEMVAERIWRQYGFTSKDSCTDRLAHMIRALNLPLRNRNESKALNGRHGRRPYSGRIPAEDLERMWKLHWQKYVSIREISRANYERYGYTNAKCMSSAISSAWKHLGLKAHDRIEMTVRKSQKDGLGPRDHRLRAQLRREAGRTYHDNRPLNPVCAGVTRKGKPCTLRALNGGEYCWSHDASTRKRVLAQTDELHERFPLYDAAEYEPFAPLQEELAAFYDHVDRATWECLAEAVGVKPNTLLKYRTPSASQNRIHRMKARRYREAMKHLTTPSIAKVA